LRIYLLLKEAFLALVEMGKDRVNQCSGIHQQMLREYEEKSEIIFLNVIALTLNKMIIIFQDLINTFLGRLNKVFAIGVNESISSPPQDIHIHEPIANR
jgi:hypothetical protein